MDMGIMCCDVYVDAYGYVMCTWRASTGWRRGEEIKVKLVGGEIAIVQQGYGAPGRGVCLVDFSGEGRNRGKCMYMYIYLDMYKYKG